jgi:hypothetical protein
MNVPKRKKSSTVKTRAESSMAFLQKLESDKTFTRYAAGAPAAIAKTAKAS